MTNRCGEQRRRGSRRTQTRPVRFLQLMRERQNKAYDLARKEDFLIKAKRQAANEKLNSVLRQRSNFEGGQRVWVYDDKSTISGAGKHVLNVPVDGTTWKSFPLVSKLARCWTGPYYVLIVGPGKAPDGDLVGRNLLLLDMIHEDSRHINARVSVHRCKICDRPHEGERRSNFLPWAMS